MRRSFGSTWSKSAKDRYSEAGSPGHSVPRLTESHFSKVPCVGGCPVFLKDSTCSALHKTQNQQRKWKTQLVSLQKHKTKPSCLRRSAIPCGKMSVSVNFSHPQPRKESRAYAESTRMAPSHAVSPFVPQSEAFLSPWMSKWTSPPSTLRPDFHPVMGCLMHFKSSSNQSSLIL